MTDNNELQTVDEPSGMLHESEMCVQLGDDFGLTGKQVINVLRNSIIKVPKNEPPATAAELVVVLSVMKEYSLNPMMKHLHAWRDNRGDLAVMLGFDGWVLLANKIPTFSGVSYECGELLPSPDGKGKKCWECVTATVHDSVRGIFTMAPTLLEEWYQPASRYPGPWQKMTKHKLRLKAYSLAIREMYGVGGIEVGDLDDMPQRAIDPGTATAAKLKGMSVMNAQPGSQADFMAQEPKEPKESMVRMGGTGNGSKTDPLIGTFHDADATIRDSEAPSTDEDPAPVTEPTEADDEDFIPCNVGGCPTPATETCSVCEAPFCPNHLNDSKECGVCELDS